MDAPAVQGLHDPGEYVPEQMNRTFIIVNPAADNGAVARFWPRGRKAFVILGIPFDEQMTEGPGHATDLARTAAENGYGTVLYVGGDGTANEVANGILTLPVGSRPLLACLPRGTGADFPTSLGINRSPRAAAARLVRNWTRSIDVVAASFTGLDGTPVRRCFLNVADVGIGGYVAERVNRTTKILGGFASFLQSTITTFWNLHKPELLLEIDGTACFDGPATTVAVANGPRFGGGMLMAPNARPDDGLFDVIVIGDIGKADLLLNLRRLYRGTHLSHPKVHAWQGREARIQSPERVPLEIDGEHPGTAPLRVWIEPQALRVLV